MTCLSRALKTTERIFPFISRLHNHSFFSARITTDTVKMTDNVWFITAASSGFGQAIAREALKRGQKVIATARQSSKLTELKAAGAVVMDLDVTSNEKTLDSKFAEANAIYGKITHVVNCAGYILEGAIEEATRVSFLFICDLPVFLDNMTGSC